MLVLLSSPSDPSAEALLARWSPHGAVRLDPSDLSLPGWQLDIGGPNGGPSRAVVAGDVVPTDRIAGVVTRRPAVYAAELAWIDPPDRAYVAAEMTAFLAAFLTALPCPVLNRPSPTCLSGPALTPEQWIRLAAGLGIPVRPLRIHAPARDAPRGDGAAAPGHEGPAAGRDLPAPVRDDVGAPIDGEALTTLTVVGRRCLGGDADPAAAGAALRLAEAAAAELLTVQFEGAGPTLRFCAASPWPDIAAPAVADALLARLSAARGGA